MRQEHEAFLDSLAAHLGMTRDQVNDAFKQARIDQIKQAMADGRIDQDRGNRMIQAIQSGQGFARPGPGGDRQGGPPQGPGPGPRRGGPPGPPGGPEGMRGPGILAASVLGLSPEELRSQLQAGKTLAQVAQDKGISRDDFKAQLIAAQKARLDQAVASGRMPSDQAQQIAARFAANVDRMIDFTPGQRGGPGGPPQSN
jgi:hypothetical protein